ncbi:MAG: AMP-binding protein, partial [Geminicoccaceae bacterium]|nr:AMP-binding protein [Geminicoccaceae bacterium]
MKDNLFQGFAATAAGRGESPFLVPESGDPLRYADLDGATARLANVLVERGVKPGDRVAAQVAKSPEAVLLYLASLRAGAVYLPLNTAYTDAELDYFLGDAEPALVVVDPKRQDGVAALDGARGRALATLDAAGRGGLTDDAGNADPAFATVARDPDDLAAILYTSGTTGRSKGAMLTHGNLASNAAALVEAWGITADDVLLHALPIYHVHGLFVALNTALLAGSAVRFLPKFDAKQALGLLPDCTMMMGVPTFYTRLLAEDGLTPETCAHMRLFVAGSAPLLAETLERFERRTGHRVLERYGMSETGMICSNPLDGERRPGAVGPPLPGVRVRVRDEGGSIAPPDTAGVLEVKGPNVFKGYWRMPEKTAQEFTDDGWFVTGDVARIESDGYVRIVGRSKDLVISGGYNVYPKEVEDVIDRLDGVDESAVIGVPHPDFGEGVV